MPGLRVLELSRTNIEFLPDSIYDMVNLRALILCDCRALKRVGSLANLEELRGLDLSWNEMEAIPDGIEKLVLLKHFSWISYHSREALPNPLSNILFHNLPQLQCLRLDDGRYLDVGVEELSGLRKLEILDVNFSDLRNLNSYTRTQHYQRLTHYRVRLNGREYSTLLGLQRNRHGFCKEVEIWECNLKESGEKEYNDDCQPVLPTNVQFLQTYKCNYFTNLLDASPCLKMGHGSESIFDIKMRVDGIPMVGRGLHCFIKLVVS